MHLAITNVAMNPGAKQDPLNYKHSDLPYGKDLFGDQLRKSIQAIFDEYCTDLVVKKLSPAANSQRNKALNSIIGSKNPKIRFYGGSSSKGSLYSEKNTEKLKPTEIALKPLQTT